jgi:hypothetical protein
MASWTEEFMKARGPSWMERLRQARGPRPWDQDRDLPWKEKLRKIKEAAAAEATRDPWQLRLERLRGEIGDDRVERISTQAVFDFLEVAQHNRGAGACRRLARVMRELGWTPLRVRDLTRGGYKEQVRGYCRSAAAAPRHP